MVLDKPYDRIFRPQGGHDPEVEKHCHLNSRGKRKVKMKSIEI